MDMDEEAFIAQTMRMRAGRERERADNFRMEASWLDGDARKWREEQARESDARAKRAEEIARRCEAEGAGEECAA